MAIREFDLADANDLQKDKLPIKTVDGVSPDSSGNVPLNVVHKSGNETISGTKTFSSQIKGSISGNAATATKATQDSAGQQINTTYVKSIAFNEMSRNLVAYKGDGNTAEVRVGHSNQAEYAQKDWDGNTITDTYATKTELSNGLNAKANDNSVVHTTGDETISGVKTFASDIYAWGFQSLRFRHIDGNTNNGLDGDLFLNYNNPDRVIGFGTKGYITANGTYYNGTSSYAVHDKYGNDITSTYATKTELSTKANDSAVVHTTGNETISGIKHFENDINCQVVNNPKYNDYLRLSVGEAWGDMSFIWVNGKESSGLNGVQGSIGIYPYNGTNNAGFTFTPDGDFVGSANNAFTANLGTSTQKWNNVYANTFHGDLSGTAYIATNAVNDKEGYTLSGVVASGDGYIRYRDGLQICWGSKNNSNDFGKGLFYINYPVPFISPPMASATAYSDGQEPYVVCLIVENAQVESMLKLKLYLNNSLTSYNALVSYIAIGRWK